MVVPSKIPGHTQTKYNVRLLSPVDDGKGCFSFPVCRLEDPRILRKLGKSRLSNNVEVQCGRAGRLLFHGCSSEKWEKTGISARVKPCMLCSRSKIPQRGGMSGDVEVQKEEETSQPHGWI